MTQIFDVFFGLRLNKRLSKWWCRWFETPWRPLWHYCNANSKVLINLRLLSTDPILTHWGRATHICVSKLTIIGSDNGLSPDWRQAIIWTSAGLLLIGPLGTNFSEILIEIPTFAFKKISLKVSSAKRRPFCLGLNVLMAWMLRNDDYHLCLVVAFCLLVLISLSKSVMRNNTELSKQGSNC